MDQLQTTYQISLKMFFQFRISVQLAAATNRSTPQSVESNVARRWLMLTKGVREKTKKT